MRCSSSILVAVLLATQEAFAADNATEDASALQVQEGWGCAGEHRDPYGRGNFGRCCRGLSKVQGQFSSERCTYQCFRCTGRNGGNRDPNYQCGGACDQRRCKVPCCEGTYEVKGYWNSGQCSYQCMCSGYGQDTYQYCSGGNPCGGHCKVPCCYPLVEVVERGRKVCRNWGEVLSQAQWEAVAANATAEVAERTSASPAARTAVDGEERTGIAGDVAIDRAAELRAVAAAATKVAEQLVATGPPRDPVLDAVDGASDDAALDATEPEMSIGAAQAPMRRGSKAYR